MGKAQKPLTIVVSPLFLDWPELEKLKAQGHTIVSLSLEADIILGPRCWRMDQDHRAYLTLAIKEARMLKYPHDKRLDIKLRKEVESDLNLGANYE